MNTKHYLVYKITNLSNGKIYIGKHETDDPNDGYMGSGKLIGRAIEKHGLGNFKKEILFDFETEEEMNLKEAELVNEDFIARDDTYNLTLGGAGSWNHCNGEASNNRHNHRRTGFLQLQDKGISPWAEKYKSLPEEEKQRYRKSVSDGLKKHFENHPANFLGCHHTEEYKQRMRELHRKLKSQVGEKNSQYGKRWWMNPETGESKSFKEGDEIPVGWVRGRRGNFARKNLQKKKISVDKQETF